MAINIGYLTANKTSAGDEVYTPFYAVEPLMEFLPKDKKMFDVKHSRCYTEYGLRRTGCVGCPFSKHINEELAIIEEHEPNLYKAAVNIFGKSYEYTAKYRAFVKEMKAKEKEQKKKDV